MKAGFYVYLTGADNHGPVVVHRTQSEAEKEAERLAIGCPGRIFQVLQIISQCQKAPPPVIWERIEDSPF